MDLRLWVVLLALSVVGCSSESRNQACDAASARPSAALNPRRLPLDDPHARLLDTGLKIQELFQVNSDRLLAFTREEHLVLLDSQSGAQIKRVVIEAFPDSLCAMLPSGKFLVIDAMGELAFYCTDTLERCYSVPRSARISSLMIEPSGSFLAFSTSDSHVVVLDIREGGPTQLREFDGQLLGISNSKAVLLRRNVLISVPLEGGALSSRPAPAALKPNPTLLFSCTDPEIAYFVNARGKITLWDPTLDETLELEHDFTLSPRTVLVATDSAVIAHEPLSGRALLLQIDLERLRVTSRLSLAPVVGTVGPSFHAGTHQVVVPQVEGRVLICSSPLRPVERHIGGIADFFVLSPAGVAGFLSEDGWLGLIASDGRSLQHYERIPITLGEGETIAGSLWSRPHSALLLRTDRRLLALEVNKVEKEAWRLRLKAQYWLSAVVPAAIAASAGSHSLVICCRSGTLWLADLSRDDLDLVRLEIDADVNTIAAGPAEGLFALGLESGTLSLVTVQDREVKARLDLPLFSQRIRSIEWSMDGMFVLVADDCEVAVVQPSAGEVLLRAGRLSADESWTLSSRFGYLNVGSLGRLVELDFLGSGEARSSVLAWDMPQCRSTLVHRGMQYYASRAGNIYLANASVGEPCKLTFEIQRDSRFLRSFSDLQADAAAGRLLQPPISEQVQRFDADICAELTSEDHTVRLARFERIESEFSKWETAIAAEAYETADLEVRVRLSQMMYRNHDARPLDGQLAARVAYIAYAIRCNKRESLRLMLRDSLSPIERSVILIFHTRKQ